MCDRFFLNFGYLVVVGVYSPKLAKNTPFLSTFNKKRPDKGICKKTESQYPVSREIRGFTVEFFRLYPIGILMLWNSSILRVLKANYFASTL